MAVIVKCDSDGHCRTMPDRPNPFKDIEELFNRMGRGLDPAAVGVHDIAVDVSETESEIIVTADLPGYKKANIDITVDDGRLTIAAAYDGEVDYDDAHYHRQERTHREVQRTIYLPADVDETEASASFRNGVLTITLPKHIPTSDDGYDIDVE